MSAIILNVTAVQRGVGVLLWIRLRFNCYRMTTGNGLCISIGIHKV